MITTRFVCEECEMTFTLKYNEELAESPPCFCSWCASYLSEEENTSEDDYEDDYETEEDE